MAAGCADCWSGIASTGSVEGAVLDWVVPGVDDAPLAGSAITEAASRAPGLPADRTLERMSSLPLPEPLKLRVVDGLAFNGYIGLQLEISRTAQLPPIGLTGYMALVEHIRAGRDGTNVERQLVRAVVGPLGLGELSSARRIRHLAAVRIPQAAQAERLAAVAWVEAADGSVVAFMQSPPAGCH